MLELRDTSQIALDWVEPRFGSATQQHAWLGGKSEAMPLQGAWTSSNVLYLLPGLSVNFL